MQEKHAKICTKDCKAVLLNDIIKICKKAVRKTEEFLTSDVLGTAVRIMHTKVTVSTNDDVKKAALSGEREGFALLADAQTGGRGRMGRQFVSGEGGVYLSLLLRPEKSAADALFITSAAAVAAAAAAESISGKSCLIKWVNDIYCRGKKICGILAEGIIENGESKAVVLGIGLNLKGGGFTGELAEKAGFLFENCDFKAERLRFIKEFLAVFFKIYKQNDREYVREVYNEKNFLLGKKFSVTQNGVLKEGIVTGIDDNFCLIFEKEQKNEQQNKY